MKKKAITVATAAVAVAVMIGLGGCAKGGSDSSEAGGNITLWTHNAGNSAELDAIQSIVDDFNASQKKTTVKVQAFPQESYNQSVTAAASSKKLPCILDIDGPNVPSWAWAGYLAPLTGLDDTLSGFLPSALGVYDAKTYSYGFYDVALTMITRKSILDANDIRIPSMEKPWTKDEFTAVLGALKESGKFDYAANFSTADVGEWYPYAYSPLLQSFGGDLIVRKTYKTADGVLNGAAAVQWGTWFQSLVKDGYIAAKSGTDQSAEFINGKVGLIYAGSWAADGARKAFGDDALFLPSVDFGHGPKIGGGSWQWGMSTNCANPDGALAYLKFAAQDKNVAAVAKAAGTIPATDGAAALVPGYQAGGDNEVFLEFAKKYAELRPITPGYPYIATTFTKATQDILNGADVRNTLDKAVKDIDANQKQNGYYK